MLMPVVWILWAGVASIPFLYMYMDQCAVDTVVMLGSRVLHATQKGAVASTDWTLAHRMSLHDDKPHACSRTPWPCLPQMHRTSLTNIRAIAYWEPLPATQNEHQLHFECRVRMRTKVLYYS